ncbi:hypothetical protein [Celeribacter sp.]
MSNRKEQPRWMKSVIAEAKKSDITLPWHRQLRAQRRSATTSQALRTSHA